MHISQDISSSHKQRLVSKSKIKHQNKWIIEKTIAFLLVQIKKSEKPQKTQWVGLFLKSLGFS